MDKKLKYLFGCSIGRSLWLAAIVLLSAQGCVTIDDNTDDCFPLARLRLEYTYNISGNDRFRNQVESLDLYVYNLETGEFISTKRYTQAELIKEDYVLMLKWLRQGDYRIVAFGNMHETYYNCYGYENTASLRLGMKCSDGQGTVTTNPGSFFYGTVELRRSETEDKALSMIKNTNDINITVRNNVPTRAQGEGLPDLAINIAVRNGTLKHDNSIDVDDNRLMTHVSENAFPQYAMELNTTLRVGRLFSDDGAQIIIKEKETGRVLSTDNLTEKIVKLLIEDDNYDGMDPNEYLDREDSYDLVYKVEMKYGVLVTTLVTIGDWNAIENPVGGV